MRQQQAEMPATRPQSGQEPSVLAQYSMLVRRYPDRLEGERRSAFEYDLRLLMTRGYYRDATGKDEVYVTDVALHPGHDRAIDAYVEYRTERGSLASGRLPVLFFLETHRFVRIDCAQI